MGFRIKELREEKKMTQEELEKKSGVSRQTISAIENGKCKFSTSKTLMALAKALEVPLDSIFFPDTVKPA